MSIVNTKNAAHLAKFGMDSAATIAFLASAVIAIGIATKAIAISSLPASLGFLGALATPLGITILLGVAVYFFLSAFASLQQLQENKDLKANINAQAKEIEDKVAKALKENAEFIDSVKGAEGKKGEQGEQGKQGKPGKNGKDADFTALVANLLKSGTIVAEGTAADEKLMLTLSTADYTVFTSNKSPTNEVTLYVILAGNREVEVKFNHVVPASETTEHKVELTQVGGVALTSGADLVKAKTTLGIAAEPLKAIMNNESRLALENTVSTKFALLIAQQVIEKAAGQVAGQGLPS